MAGVILTQSNQQIYSMVTSAAIRKLSRNFFKHNSIKLIEDVVRKFVIEAIKSSVVWQSLEQAAPDDLPAHFGIPRNSRSSQLEELLKIWAEEIKVIPSIPAKGRNFRFSYTFYAIKADWGNVLVSPAGVTINISKNHPEGQLLPWLSWLLVSGDEIEVTGYKISEPGNYPRSRSGQRIMLKAEPSWVIPKGFVDSFNTNDNFVTQQLSRIANDKLFRGRLSKILEDIGSFSRASSLGNVLAGLGEI